MRSYPLIVAAAATAVVSAALTGCSSGTEQQATSTPSSSAASSPATTSTALATHTAAPGDFGISPGGVTTAVGAPTESTEDEYFQACHAATMWMAERGGDPKAQFEPYLADLQKTDSAGLGTFNVPWSKLTPNRQAAVIVAADAASDGLCS